MWDWPQDVTYLSNLLIWASTLFLIVKLVVKKDQEDNLNFPIANQKKTIFSPPLLYSHGIDKKIFLLIKNNSTDKGFFNN